MAERNNVLSRRAVEERLLLQCGRRTSYLAVYTGHVLALRGSESQLKIQISRHNIADENK